MSTLKNDIKHVPFELALQAKMNGFNQECLAYYLNLNDGHSTIPSRNIDRYTAYWNDYPRRVSAPLYQQLLEWFITNHNIVIYAKNYYFNTIGFKPEYEVYVNNKQLYHETSSSTGVDLYASYYEALDRGIEEAFKIINKNERK